MTIAQATAPRKRKRRALVWMIVIVVALALLAAGGFAAASYLRMWAQGSPDATEVAMPVAGPDSGLRRSFYSFGHTSTAIFLQTASPKVVEQRLPFQLGVVPQQFRVRVENIDYLGDERLGDIEIQSVYLGHMTGEGEFETDVRLSGREETRNSKFVTDWFDQETMQLDTDEEYLLGISFSAPAKTRVGVAPGVGWIRQGTENGALVDDKNRGAFQRAGTYLDISIDYTFEGEDVPVVAVFGHSLNAGANQNPDVPHKGEVEVWHQLWARDHGGSAASFAAAGAWTANFLADSPKWDRAADVDADYVAIWASSSDLVAGTTPDEVGSYWVALIAEARERWPDAQIVAFTEPPRGADGEGEQFRRQWNDFLRTSPEQIDVLVDTDKLLADPKNRRVLSPDYDGDGSHFSPAGHEAVARAFAKAISAS